MISLKKIRASNNKIIVLGNHVGIIQSILDFDYLCGQKSPSVIGIMGNGRGVAKYFWGRQEILLPLFSRSEELRLDHENNLWLLNLLSGRRTLASTCDLITSVKNIVGAVLFAENVPELHAQALANLAKKHDLLLIGPSSVGLVVPGSMKLGPIAGVTPEQILSTALTEQGSLAIISASGGMTNELINTVRQAGKKLSLAFSTGGDRFPLPEITQAFLLAQNDSQTQAIVYYGELGGIEEYELIKLKQQGKLTKPVLVHISGTVADLFPESPQFGHAKAKAETKLEKALAKRQALAAAGFLVTEKFSDLLKLTKSL